MKLNEESLEESCIQMLEAEGYRYVSPEEAETRRGDLGNVVFADTLRQAIARLNPAIPESARDHALKQIMALPNELCADSQTANLAEHNETFHRLLTEGVPVEYQKNGDTVGGLVQLVDWQQPRQNELVVTQQFTVHQGHANKRPDVVLLINGLPLVVIELKHPVDPQATIKKAFTQLGNYKTAISSLFVYNGLLVISDGFEARAGSLTAGWPRFMQWKTIDGSKEGPATVTEMQTLIQGMLRLEILLDLIKQFTVFEKAKKEDKRTGQLHIETIKKIAAYHQYHAVNRAVASTKKAASQQGSRKAGVVWHTQGSGKSLSMVFYAGKVVLGLDNPTIVVMTDRNDLDDQLFDTFAQCKQLLRQEPVQAKDRADLKRLLKTSGGGIIFTTIQKFSPQVGSAEYELLSERNNIIVIADEAHRSQYGFGAKITETASGIQTRYGNAKYLRDGLPNASFIGFTGTPIENEDKSTPAVFGDYVDTYDIAQAMEDGATVRIFYESRLAKVHLKEEEKDQLDAAVESIAGDEESTAKEKAKAKWTQLEAIVGHKDRLACVAQDCIQHFEERKKAKEMADGKAMFVAMSRRVAVELYEAIVALRPDWHSPDPKKGAIKVVMTSSSSDPASWQQHHTTKQDRKALGERLKDPSNPLQMVIVRDMWLTGFDAPCLHTLYVDKPMKGHNLMQAIARVNRVYGNKPGGLVVDYIGIASDLKKALANYTQSGGKGQPILNQEEAVMAMLEKHEVVMQMFHGFNVQSYVVANAQEKMNIILEAQEHILGLEDGKKRFTKEVGLLSKAFALSVPHLKAMQIKEEVAFFQAIKARIHAFERSGGKTDEEMENAIRQAVDRAVVADGVIDIFDAAGIKKPDISILSDEFLEEVKGMKHKNIALELLKKILNDEIRTRSKKNVIQSKKLSQMLESAIKRYQNNLVTAAQVIEEMIALAKDIRSSDARAAELGLEEYELAFYDALAENDSAKDVFSNDKLCDLARVLGEKVRANASIDWTIKESVQANLRRIVKRTLRIYGYPPDMQKLATDNILKQAELYADDWSRKERSEAKP